MENLDCCSCLAHNLNGLLRDFHRGKDPHPGRGLLLHTVGLFLQYSETKKYRQETLLSKVESERSVILKLLV